MNKKKNLIEKMEDLTIEEEATHDQKNIPKSKPKPMVVSISTPKAAWVCCFSVNLLLDFVVFWVCSLWCLQWCLPSLFSTLSYGFVSGLWVLESLRLEFFGVILKGKKICLWLVAKVFVVDVFLLF